MAVLSSLLLAVSTFKILKYYRKANPVCAAVLTCGMYQAAAPIAVSEFDRSGVSKSPFRRLHELARERLPPRIVSYIMLDPEVEYSKLKLLHRVFSVASCSFLILIGNSMLLNAFKIRDQDAVDALNGWVAVVLGYSIISVINQANMLYWQTEDKADIPEDKAEVPEDKAEVPEDKADIPEDKAEVPEDKAEVPEDKAEVPEDKAEVPEDKAEVPEDKAEVPKYDQPNTVGTRPS